MKQTTWLAATGAAVAIGLALVGVAVASSPSPLPDPSASRPEEPTTAPAVETVEPSVVVEPSVAVETFVAVPYSAQTAAPTAAPANAPATLQTTKTTEDAPDVEPANTELTDKLTVVTDADGDTEYMVGTTRVSVGPPWFWGTNHPFKGLVDTTVTVTGHMDDGTGPKKDKANGTTTVRVPEFEVYAVNGKTIREPGKPDWAGGPKKVGATHPGYAGWSKNHPKETPTP
jgi:hypothetical protein